MVVGPRAHARSSDKGASAGWVFPCEPSQVPQVRRAVESVLEGCARREDVVLVAGELASNSVTHSVSRRGGRFAVELHQQRGRVELRVHDGGGEEVPHLLPAPPDPLERVDLPAEEFEHGRGLLLVEAHADEWGQAVDANGCTVYARFTLPGSDLPDSDLPSSDLPSSDLDTGQADTDFDGPGGITQPPESVFRYLLRYN